MHIQVKHNGTVRNLPFDEAMEQLTDALRWDSATTFTCQGQGVVVSHPHKGTFTYLPFMGLALNYQVSMVLGFVQKLATAQNFSDMLSAILTLTTSQANRANIQLGPVPMAERLLSTTRDIHYQALVMAMIAGAYLDMNVVRQHGASTIIAAAKLEMQRWVLLHDKLASDKTLVAATVR